MFSALQEYAVSRGLSSPPGMNTKNIHWRIDLDREGRYLGLSPLIDAEGQAGRRFPNVPEQKANVMNAGGRSHFMVETVEVVTLLGLEKRDEKRQKAILAKHEYFVSLLKDSSGSFPPNGLCARVLEDKEMCSFIQAELSEHKAKPTQVAAFAVDGELLVSRKEWHAWWQQRRALEGASRDGLDSGSSNRELMRCLMTGELVAPVASHDKVKGLGVIGGQALSSLVSFDKDSFPSFGLEQASNAAMSETAVKTYLDAMNDLIQKGTVYSDLGIMVLTWFRDPLSDPDDNPAALLDRRYEGPDNEGGEDRVNEDDAEDAEEEEYDEDRDLAAKAAKDPGRISGAERLAKELLRAVETGERQDLKGNRFHIIILSSSGARIMVRDYRDVSFVELARNVDQWFDDTRLVNLYSVGGMLNPPRFKGLVASVASLFVSGKLDWKSVPASLATDLYLAALLNEPIPYAALEKAVLRLRNEAISSGMLLKGKDAKVKAVNYGALQLIRAYHVRKDRSYGKNHERSADDMQNPTQPGLNPDHPATAYQLGRLMAVLADLQKHALGEVGAGVIERYYGSFSTTPGVVYGRLVHLAQNHLSKLESGLRYLYNKELSAISAKIAGNPPNTLIMEEQSLFALGYYQQMHHMIERTMEGAARRKAEKAAAEEEASAIGEDGKAKEDEQ